ncbi:N-acetyltransferase [Capsulimonas corticalis]|uniref:N-acetyltransferase n=1 Tax=Capsulimonas corticalis TaxID=2219043 RepID=A0A402D536_9BACT|nr:GNAT family N-acetyltransferase [Capsulimonas corticalis]BDI32551.1 N-acetyltransferase [Capsulimonas corticalis]
MLTMETDRLLLRPFRAEDFDELHHILSDAKTMQFWPAPFSREATQGWMERNIVRCADDGHGRMAMVQKQTGVIVGDCGIVPLEINGALENDLGYIVHHAFWNRGYASEAAAAQLDFGLRSLLLKRICANMPTTHGASRRIAEKIGMQYAGEFLNTRNRMIPTCLYTAETAD